MRSAAEGRLRTTSGCTSPARAPPLDEFTRLSRDLYIPSADAGFRQESFRDPRSEEHAAARRAIEARADDDGWLVPTGRHRNLDRPNRR